MTAVEQLIYQLTSIGVLEIPQGSNAVTSIIEQAKEMEKEQSNAKIQKAIEVFDMLYKTDKFLMVDLREYWKTIEK